MENNKDKLKYIDHGVYIIDRILYINYNVKNPNVKKKEYIRDNTEAINNEKLSYIQVIYNNNPIFM